MESIAEFWKLAGLRYKSHPWHGVEIGEDAPDIVNVYVEVVPTDTMKYELDKQTGYLKIDRPNKFSSFVPALYGFIPQTYCGKMVAQYSNIKNNRKDITGDQDPLDICVLTERNIMHGDILLKAIPIGGFRMIDGGEADDKIIATLKGDEVYGDWNDIDDIPETLIRRLKHYFLTYKDMPGQTAPRCEITHIYGSEEAHEVINRSRKDYDKKFGKLENKLSIAAMEAMVFAQEMMVKKNKRNDE